MVDRTSKMKIAAVAACGVTRIAEGKARAAPRPPLNLVVRFWIGGCAAAPIRGSLDGVLARVPG
jgi:hypothetical protein